MAGGLGNLELLAVANLIESGPVGSQVALARRISQTKRQRIHSQRFAQLVDQALHGKGRLRCARRAKRLRLGLVDDDVVAVHPEVAEPVGREATVGPAAH